MLDWQGLLKFSLQHSDGTQASQFKQMSAQDKQFLQQALNQYCNVELRRIGEIIEQINKAGPTVDHLSLLQQLQQLLQSLDKGNLLYKLQGHIPLLRIVFYSQHSSSRVLALQILSAANQNDASVQNESIAAGALEIAELIEKEPDMKVRENMMGVLSAMVRGENLEAKRVYIRLGGLDVLARLLKQSPSVRLVNKANNLLRDLLYYDEYLHQTYHDLSAFSNTAGLKVDPSAQQADLKYDVNAEKAKDNYMPQNEKYRGWVHRWMKDNKPVLEQYLEWLKKQNQVH